MAAPALKVQLQGVTTVSSDNLNTYEQTCDTIAQLRGFVGADGVQVFVRGSVAPNDGNAGEFYWDDAATGPDNGTTVIVPTGSALGAWIRLSLFSSQLTIRNFGAIGNGYTDDSGSIRKMLTALGFAIVPNDGGIFYVASEVLVGVDQTVTGGGIIKGSTGNGTFLITGSYGSVSDIQFQANGASGLVTAVGAITTPVVENCTATGPIASEGTHYAFIGDASSYGGYGTLMINPILRGCSYVGYNEVPADTGGGVLFESCTDFICDGLSIDNQQDTYGIAVLWSKGKITNPNIQNYEIGTTLTGTGSQTTFVFTIPNGLSAARAAVQISGVPTTPSSLTSSSNGETWTAVFGSAPGSGDPVRLVAFACPEMINVNSQSKVFINDYSLSCCGDSGIVFGCDWHNTGSAWVNGSGQVGTDLPFKCFVGQGEIDTVLASGISATTGVNCLTLTGGHNIENYAMGPDPYDFFNSAISISNHFQTSGTYWKIGTGLIDNSSGFGQGGILIDSSHGDDGTQNKFAEVSPQIYIGSFVRGGENFFSLTGSNNLNNSIKLRDRFRRLWPTQPDILTSFTTNPKPANGNGFTFTIDGGSIGVTQSDSGTGNGVHCWAARSLQSIQGGQLNILPTNEGSGTSLCNRSVFSVSFMAISQGSPVAATASYVIITAEFAGSTTGTFVFPILNTVWQPIEITASMLGALYLSSVSFGSPATTGLVANIEELSFGMYDLI